MKQILLAAGAALGVAAFAAPAQAALFQWNVNYTDFFADGASIDGFFIADAAAAADGYVSTDEFEDWAWNWSGNSEVDAVSISSDEGGEIQTFFGPAGFFVDGTANVPGDDASEGVYGSDSAVIDLDFLFVDTFASGFVTGSTTGDVAVSDGVAVAEPIPVPEPATLLGLLTLAGTVAVAKRQKHAA